MNLFSVLLMISTSVHAADPAAMLKKLDSPGTPGYGEAITYFLEFGHSDEAVAVLNKGLEDDNEDIRKASIQISKRLKDDRLFEGLKKIVVSNQALAIRREAFSAAALNRKHPELGGLISRVINDAAPELKVQALRTLLRLKGSDAIPKLKAALKDNSDLVKIHAAFNLSELGNTAGHEVARAAVRHSNKAIRATAVETLGLLGSQSDLVIISSLAENKSESIIIRNAAACAQLHANIAKLSFEDRVRTIANSLDAKTVSGNWALKASDIMLDVRFDDFIRQIRIISQEDSRAGLGARTFLSQHPGLE